jgi:ERCC4-type nuclease
MIIKVDVREQEVLGHIKQLVLFVPIFKQLKVVSENLPIGDFIIADDKEDKLIIERKSVTDLLASIKDGRYEEQSYRLNGLDIHNHNIIYLIEGDVNRVNRFKGDNKTEKLTAYSAMFSLNYFKGFSVFRTFNIEETATIICNMAYKLEKDLIAGKKGFYQLNTIKPSLEEKQNEVIKIETDISSEEAVNINENISEKEKEKDKDSEEEIIMEQSDKDYVNVIKKVKKENITPENICEIMLCQIPGISSVSALAIMDKFKTLPNLITQIEQNNDCLKDISYTNSKGQTRKINKTCASNIVKYLLKK